jgi:stalled ribosome alternative rescue factor ArfA
MLGWVLESQNDSPNRIYALHLPPLFRQQRENSRHGLSRELPP